MDKILSCKHDQLDQAAFIKLPLLPLPRLHIDHGDFCDQESLRNRLVVYGIIVEFLTVDNFFKNQISKITQHLKPQYWPCRCFLVLFPVLDEYDLIWRSLFKSNKLNFFVYKSLRLPPFAAISSMLIFSLIILWVVVRCLKVTIVNIDSFDFFLYFSWYVMILERPSQGAASGIHSFERIVHYQTITKRSADKNIISNIYREVKLLSGGRMAQYTLF